MVNNLYKIRSGQCYNYKPLAKNTFPLHLEHTTLENGHGLDKWRSGIDLFLKNEWHTRVDLISWDNNHRGFLGMVE